MDLKGFKEVERSSEGHQRVQRDLEEIYGPYGVSDGISETLRDP